MSRSLPAPARLALCQATTKSPAASTATFGVREPPVLKVLARNSGPAGPNAGAARGGCNEFLTAGRSAPRPLRQGRQVALGEGAQVGDVDAAVGVEVQEGEVGRVGTYLQVSPGEQAQVGHVHAAVAVGVAVIPEEALGVAERVVVARRAVAVAVELEAARRDLGRQGRQRVAAVGQRPELGGGPAEAVERD